MTASETRAAIESVVRMEFARRAIDLFRRNRQLGRKYAEIGRDLQAAGDGVIPDFDRAFSDHIDDDLLRLVFTACHPVLAVQARVALTLRLLGGLTTASATAGDDWMRPELCADALRLGRTLAQLTPAEPEVHGLVALVEIQSSRAGARTGPSGEPILLLEQNRARWDRLLINRGLAALARAEGLGGERGPYALQAAIAACHARAFRAEDTDWPRLAALYAILAEVSPSPVVELNRAVAVSMAFGAGAGTLTGAGPRGEAAG